MLHFAYRCSVGAVDGTPKLHPRFFHAVHSCTWPHNAPMRHNAHACARVPQRRWGPGLRTSLGRSWGAGCRRSRGCRARRRTGAWVCVACVRGLRACVACVRGVFVWFALVGRARRAAERVRCCLAAAACRGCACKRLAHYSCRCTPCILAPSILATQTKLPLPPAPAGSSASSAACPSARPRSTRWRVTATRQVLVLSAMCLC